MNKIYLYPQYIRLWHMLNALFMLVLIVTGLCMQYSSPNGSIIPFPIAVRMHNISGIVLAASYLVFLIGNILSGNGKHYRLQWKGLRNRMIVQGGHYLYGYFKKQSPPYPISKDNKFNPLQAVTYVMVMYIGLPIVVITGFGLLFPEIIVAGIFGVNGLVLTALVHVIMGFLLSIFMIVHIYLCTMGASPKHNFRAIVTGWHSTGGHNE
jgi:thiosulfate reductase cytochrome b subunit